MITAAEGGIILTDDDHLADEARAYRDQGKASFTANVHTHLGYNWRMSEPHAAIAVSQLARLDEFIAHRQLIVDDLKRFFDRSADTMRPADTPQPPPGAPIGEFGLDYLLGLDGCRQRAGR